MKSRFLAHLVVVTTISLALLWGSVPEHLGMVTLASASAGVHTAQDDGPGCTKNNPERPDCSSLEVTGQCEANVAVFTIRNTGEAGNGDMVSATQYRIIVDGVVVETGSVQLAGDTTMEVRYSGGGTSVRLEADQQPGHPGSSQPRVTLNCVPPTEAPTEPPPTTPAPTLPPTTPPPTTPPPTDPPATTPPPTTVTAVPTGEPTQPVTPPPTEAPTETPMTPTPPTETPPPTPEPTLRVESVCTEDGMTTFVITNISAEAQEGVDYSIYNADGYSVDSGLLSLLPGESVTLAYPSSYGRLSISLASGLYAYSTNCLPELQIGPYCMADGSPAFAIVNVGGNMTEPAPYVLYDVDFNIIEEGTVFLQAGEQHILTYPGWLGIVLILDVNNGQDVERLYCDYVVVTEPPTETPPPTTPPPTTPPPTTPPPTTPPPTTPAPTTPAPTTPAPTTPAPTTPPVLGCQRNNPGRLDCSSLEVTAVCQGNVAVFTIRNTGEPGEGNMVSATQYRLIVAGTLLQTGPVQLAGGATMQVTYTGGLRVTLEADQQVGHPGKSQPRATITCR